MNVFEAGRRVAILAMIACALFSVAVAAHDEFRWRDIQNAGQMLGAGCVAIVAASYAVGWVLRGLLGIPQGADHLPPSETHEPPA